MNVVPPIWHLNRFCPCCGQGSALTYQKCTKCGRALLICEETDQIFVNGLKAYAMAEYKGICDECGSPVRPFTGEEFREMGYKKDEYY